MARLQLSQFTLEDDLKHLPLWQQLDPAWPQEIEDFDRKNNTDIQAWLTQHGMRLRDQNVGFGDRGVLFSPDNHYLEDQPQAEEGHATEREVWSSCIPF